MLVVDTSVWVDHFRAEDAAPVSALVAGRVLTHPFVIGELACGNLRNRRGVLDLLGRLPSAPAATHAEVLVLVERHGLAGRGIGWVDVHLLASTALAGTARLWSQALRTIEAFGGPEALDRVARAVARRIVDAEYGLTERRAADAIPGGVVAALDTEDDVLATAVRLTTGMARATPAVATGDTTRARGQRRARSGRFERG